MFNKSTCVRIADLQQLHLQCHPSAARNGPAVQKSFCWQLRSSPPPLEPDDLNPGIPLKFPFTYLPCIGNSPHDPEIHIPLHLSLDTVHCFSNRLRVIPFLTLSDGNSRHSSGSIKKMHPELKKRAPPLQLRGDALSIYFFFINNLRPTNAIKARNP